MAKHKPAEVPLSEYTFNNHVAIKNASGVYEHFATGDPVPDWVLGEDADGNPFCDEAHYEDLAPEDDGPEGSYERLDKTALVALAGDRNIPSSGTKGEIIERLKAEDAKNR